MPRGSASVNYRSRRISYFDLFTRCLSPHFIAHIRLNAFTHPLVRESDSLTCSSRSVRIPSEIDMKILILGATGATGRLIVRDAVAKGHGVVALVRSKVNAADFVGAEHIEV